MINTPEFWVSVSFFICLVFSFKLIFPKIRSGLDVYQSGIETSFLDAENILKDSEKKFSLIQERLTALPQLMADMELEFDAKVNHKIHEWSVQKEKTIRHFAVLQEYKLQHLTNHVKSQIYWTISTVVLNVLEAYFMQHITPKRHQQLVKDAVKNLDSV